MTTRRSEPEQTLERTKRELDESQARFDSLFAHNPDAMLAVSVDGTITEINDACMRLGGFALEQIVGQPYAAFLPSHEHARSKVLVARVLRGENVNFTLDSFRADGSQLELEATLIPRYSSGNVVGFYGIMQDISAQRAAERRAEMQRKRIRSLYFIAASSDFPDVRMRASLEMGCRALGLAIGTVVDATGPTLRLDAVHRNPNAPDIQEERLFEMARYVIEHGASAAPVAFPDGLAARLDIGTEPFGALVFASTLTPTIEFSETDADLLGLISTLIAGVIERSRQRARLRSMAYYDALTGLPNRTFLTEKLRDAVEIAQSRLGRVALLFLDLDHFKDVNESLGHLHGDRLLQLVAQRLVAELAERGTVARTGGDEFMVLLMDCDGVAEVRAIAESILASISEPFTLSEYEQFICASIGVSVYPEDGRDAHTLMKNADIAMYRAKDRGRNGYYFYNSALESPIHMRISQEKLLRRALDNNEFLIYYQPQLDIRSGEIIAVEALVRWNHPKAGLIEPSHFIPSAEISGLIVPLGTWVLETAARQVTQWRTRFGALRLAVNLSARQFYQRELRTGVLVSIASAGLEPNALELEITESAAMSDAAQAVGIVRDLKSSGIRIAVDDFGTGYSSLTYLRRFSLDVLKIDRSFVSGVGGEQSDETIVKTVIAMAQSMSLEVVAEGVETLAQLAFLTEHGCDVAQGFIIAPPLAPDDFERYLVERRERIATAR